MHKCCEALSSGAPPPCRGVEPPPQTQSLEWIRLTQTETSFPSSSFLDWLKLLEGKYNKSTTIYNNADPPPHRDEPWCLLAPRLLPT
uniref:Uncharacterized protein n=1 Tax=Setaria viridis TaxID=4556 RepID=A0A4U6U0R9_SETVI|nr:hypothetical protein SEVIR_6G063760v2 [Setaria viridis]